MNTEDIQCVFENELGSIEPSELRLRVRRCAITPVQEVRKFESEGRMLNAQVWLVATLSADVAIAFSAGAFNERTLRWGLVFRSRNDVGDSGSWYRSLAELVADCGYF